MVIYIVLAVVLGYVFIFTDDQRQHAYRIEVNRIMASLTDIHSIDDIELSSFEYIKDIDFLDGMIFKQETVESFFQEDNTRNIMIQPFYSEHQLKGYIKFIYQIPTFDKENLLIVSEIVLLIIAAMMLSVLLYMRKKIVIPFYRLSTLPEELAKGHFRGDVKEEKSRYLGRFMWGMGQLKDTLEISRQRQLELMKEKKTMLLSLSHDIKTPLNLIKLYHKALQEDIYTDESQKKNALHQIGEKTEDIEKYVERIIQSSREDILDLPVHNSEFYLSDLLKRVLGVYQEQCLLRHIDLSVMPFENRLLKGDIERSQEVFENLFENAFKYGDGRKIEISFAEEDYCQLIRIYNTGYVIDDHEFNHLFESFYRGANAQGVKGSGLGLYICRELMQKMDGTIFAEKDDEGMAFVMVFR